MALTTTQVNQAFLGLLGRPATGAEAGKFASTLDVSALAQTLLSDASFKSQLSVEALSFKTVDLLNADPAAFVESLYTALLGRASDAEGKAFWLAAAGITPNRADVVSQFIAAVQAQEGTADANAFASIQAEDKALANAWVESLYNNLAGRASDAEGLDFWTNAIVSFTMTPAQVAASFAAALALQGNTTEDGQNFAAKVGVADAFTASFKDFSAIITANEKAEQLGNLVTMMNGVNKDSQVDQYTDEISKNVNEFQNFKAIQFTTSDEDDLGIDPETGESNLNGAANFTGTYNLTDATKGTIQSSDSATGNPDYLTDTLTINVTGYDKTTHADFDLGELPSTTSVEKLVINNGAANVSGSISGDFEYINVNGTGEFSITATAPDAETGLKDISLNSAAKTDNKFTTTDKVVSFKSAAGNDTVELGTVSKSLSTGAGDDTVTANLGKGATADLGAGDDTFNGSLDTSAKLTAGAGDDTLTVTGTTNYKLDKNGDPIKDKKGNPIVNASIEIDGGTGNDTLDLSTNIDFQGIKSIRGIENLKIGAAATLTASAISGQKLELSSNAANSVLTLKAENGVDLSKISKADGETVKINVDAVKSGNVNLSANSKDFHLVEETVTLAKDANKVAVKGFEQGYDHIAITVDDAGNTAVADNTVSFFTHNAQDKATGVDFNSIVKDTIYFVNLKDTVSKKAINDLLGSNKFNLAANESFYIVATDSENIPGVVGAGNNSTAKIYKIEVGKDGKVGKLDQMATVNVADKAQLSAQDFGAGTAGGTISADIKDITVDPSGNLDLSNVTLSDATKNYSIDLSSNSNVNSINTITLPTNANASAIVISSTGTNKPAGAVAVEIPATAKIGTLTVGSAADNTVYNVTVNGSGVNKVLTNNVDNVIDITGSTTVQSINAGEGNDTLKISGTSADNLTEMSSVERIEFTGTSINADAIVANNSSVTSLEIAQMKSTGTEELEIKVDTQNNIDLSKLVQATGDSGDASLKITGVKDGNVITLTTNADTAHTFTETVALGTATNVTVNNVQAGDLVTSNNFTLNGSFAELKGTIETGKLYFTTVTAGQTAQQTVDAAIAAASFKGDAIIAVNSSSTATGNADIFVVKAGVATQVVKVDNIINGQDSIANGTLAFDGESPVPPTPVTEPAKIKAQKIVGGGDNDYELVLSQAPLDVNNKNVTLSLDNTDAITTLKAASAVMLTINATGDSGTVSFDPTVTAKTAALTNVKFDGTGTRTINLDKVNATAIVGITDGAANTTLDLSAYTFDGTATDNKFKNGLDINLGDGTDIVVLQASGGTGYASGAFTLTGVEGIKVSGDTATKINVDLLADKVTVDSDKIAYTSKISQLEGKALTINGFDASNTKTIDLSGITKVAENSAITIDVTAVTPANLTSVKGTAGTNDTLLLGNAATAADKDYSKITEISGIEKISLGAVNSATSGATINFTAIKDAVKEGAAGITLVSDAKGSGAFIINTDKETTIDLTGLKNGSGAEAIAGVTIQDVVAKSTVTLNVDDKLVETIKLAKLDTKENAVTITGANLKEKITIGDASQNDKIDFSATVASLAGTNSNKLEALPNASNGTTHKGAYVLQTSGDATLGSKDVTALTKEDLTTKVGKVASEASGSQAVVFVSNSGDQKDLTGVYLVTGNNSATTIKDIQLIATINGADITATTYKVDGGVLQFA